MVKVNPYKAVWIGFVFGGLEILQKDRSSLVRASCFVYFIDTEAFGDNDYGGSDCDYGRGGDDDYGGSGDDDY